MITGHTGFKGTWLTFLLERLEIPVVGYSLPATKGSLFERSNRVGMIPEVFADIRDLASIKAFLELHKPAAVFHLAAQPLVLESYKKPLETFEINVMGTANLLSEAFSIETIKAIAVITTDKVYKNDNAGRKFVETDALSGKDPYSASKVGTEAVISAWKQIQEEVGGPLLLSLRSGNVIGGGDWADDRLIPDLVRAFSLKETINLRHPESTRPWQHVLDPILGYLAAMECVLTANASDTFNFGPDTQSLSVKRIAEIAQMSWPFPTDVGISGITPVNESEALILNLDSQKARDILHWSPFWSQDKAVVSTLNWWNEVLNKGVKSADACARDIEFVLKSLAGK
jgi:CDP-glucose 4,6-dehydratase